MAEKVFSGEKMKKSEKKYINFTNIFILYNFLNIILIFLANFKNELDEIKFYYN